MPDLACPPRALRGILALLCAAALTGAEIHLADGSVLDGDIVAEDAAAVRVRLVQGGMAAERSVPRAQIARIVPGDSPRTRALAGLRGEAAALPAGAAAGAWTALAQRARELDPALARAWAAQAVARDRHQAEAQRLLGRELVGGVWLRPHEAAVARGLVWHDGRWLAWSDRERLLAEERERQERLRATLAAAAERAEQRRARAAASSTWYGYGTYAYIPRVRWWGGVPSGGFIGGSTCWTGGWGGSLVVNGGSGNTNWNLNITW